MRILFETKNGNKILTEFKNGKSAKKFIVENKSELSKAQIIEEGITQDIGKGAILLACVGATILGLVKKPEDAMCKVHPEEPLEVSTVFQNGNEQGKRFYSQDAQGNTSITSSSKEGSCKRLSNNDVGNNSNDYLYSLECQSENGEYTIEVVVHNYNSSYNEKTNNTSYNKKLSSNTITVSSSTTQKSINLDDPKFQNLKNIVKTALMKDKKDGKIVNMIDDAEVGVTQMDTDFSSETNYESSN